MSAVAVGVGAGALVSVGFGIGAWMTDRRRSAMSDFRRADRFAREVDLRLPWELVPEVAARLRRRTVLGLALTALVFGPLLGYGIGSLAALAVAPPVNPADTHVPPMPAPVGVLMGLLFGSVVAVLEGVWELVRLHRQVDSKALPRNVDMTVRLRDAVPVSLVWAARGLAVLPPLVAAVASEAQGRAGVALGFLALVPPSGVVAWSVERLQLRTLNAKRLVDGNGLFPQRGASDDAFRVTTALPMTLLAPCVCVLAGDFYIQLAGRGWWYGSLMLVWSLTAIPMLLLNVMLNARWAKRYHRRSARRLPDATHASG